MKFTLAYLIGVHLIGTDLYNHHPAAEFGESVMVYQNSFKKPAAAVYKTFKYDNFKLRAGLTTGYYDIQEYKGKYYEVKTATKDGIGLFLVPSYEKGNFVFAILGDSINAGLKWEFK